MSNSGYNGLRNNVTYLLKYKNSLKGVMNTKQSLPIVFASVIAFALIFVVAPSAMADSEDGTNSYKRHWAIDVADYQGTDASLKITEDTDKRELAKQALPLDEVAADYTDIQRASLSKAVNVDGEYFLVWKLVNYNYDEETDTKTQTIYVVDAGAGNEITQYTKEGGCGDRHKSETTLTSGDNA